MLSLQNGDLEAIQNYREDDSFNFSFLKDVLENNLKPFKGSLASIYGSAIDCLLFFPEGFNDLFYVENVKRPNGILVDIIEEIKDSEWDLEYLIDKARKVNYGNGKNSDEVLRKKFEDLKYWYDVLEEQKDRNFLTEQEYRNSLYWVKRLKEEEPSKSILSNSFFQVPHFTDLTFEDNGIRYTVKAKCLPDIITPKYIKGKLDHIVVTDLKCTTYNYRHWVSKVAKDNYYYMQQSFYVNILKNIYKVPIKAQWLVVSYSSNKISIIKTDERDIEFGRIGANSIVAHTYNDNHEIRKEIYIPGYQDAILKYLQASKLKLKDYDIEYALCGGIFQEKSIFE